MAQQLVCHHGHRMLGVPAQAAKLACPICGSVSLGKVKRGTVTAHDLSDRTLAADTTGVDQAMPGATIGATLDSTGFRTAATVQMESTVDYDGSGPAQTISVQPTTVDVPADADGQPDEGMRTLPADVMATMDAESPVTEPDVPAGPPTIDTPDDANRTTAAMQVESQLVGPPRLAGYQVVDELGRGGMGVVYRAHDERLGRDVALKTLQRINPIELQRFKQEFRALADIAHPNLASLYDLVSDGDTWCFTMEILESVEFTEFVWSGFQKLDLQAPMMATRLRGSRLDEATQQRLRDGLKQLTLGLNALHQAGMLHRDIKPSNVLVTRDGRVAMVDFGLVAEIKEDDDGPRGIQGTPEYMAPEQAACRAMSPASDWYAVGVMLYELLTGRLPIEGKPIQLITKKNTATPQPPRELEPSAPPELSELCLALLERDPENRPTAEDVLRCIGADDALGELRVASRVSATTSIELVGRERHLDRLDRSFEELVSGTTQSIFVHGNSGMGKSVLVDHFLDHVGEQATVLRGRCYEQESVPFKALDSLVDSLATHLGGLPDEAARLAVPEDSLPLVRLFPVLGQAPGATDAGKPSIDNVDQQELRQRAMNALRELLTRLGNQTPVVAYIDDLQWGDEDSADVIGDLVRPPGSPRVMLLGSYRTENRTDSVCLQALDTAYTSGQTHPHREEIEVESLTEADAQRLALMLLERKDASGQELAAKIARESGGWPFFVWELAQHVADDPDIADQSLELDEVIWTRVNRLPEQAQRLLELVAVSGRPLPASEAYEALEVVEQGRGLLAQLRTSNFVRTTESEDADTIVETYHDRVRESVVDHLEDATVKHHNLQLALTIDRVSGINVEELHTRIAKTPDFEEPDEAYELDKRQRVFDLAYFYDAAGEHERAFPYALVAAEQARKQDAQEVAEQQYQIALRGVGQMSSALRFRVHEGLGDVLTLRARYAEADEHFNAARELAYGKLVLARIDWKLGVASFKGSRMREARDYLEKAARGVGERPPTKLTVVPRFLKEAFVQFLHTKFPNRFVRQLDPDSEAGKLDMFRARALDQLTFAYWFTRGMKFVLWTHLRHMNVAEHYGATPELGKAYSMHAVVMTGIPMATRGIAYARRAYTMAEAMAFRWGQGRARCYHTFGCITTADFQEGIETGSEAVRLLEEAGDIWEANMARMIMAVPMYHAGDLKGAHREARKAYETGLETGDYSAAAIALVFWLPAAPHRIPAGAVAAEVERERFDPLASTAVIFARALELLLRENKPREAADKFGEMIQAAKRREFRDCCLFAAVTWRVHALRIVAEREPEGSSRRRAIKVAKRALRNSLSLTKSYRACRPFALREAGILAALEGKEKLARRYFDESLAVAEQFEARYDIARTVLARGEAGLQFGWPDSEEAVTYGRALVEELEDVGD